MVSEMLRWLIIPYEHNLWDGKWDVKMVDYSIWTQSTIYEMVDETDEMTDHEMNILYLWKYKEAKI